MHKHTSAQMRTDISIHRLIPACFLFFACACVHVSMCCRALPSFSSTRPNSYTTGLQDPQRLAGEIAEMATNSVWSPKIRAGTWGAIEYCWCGRSAVIITLFLIVYIVCSPQTRTLPLHSSWSVVDRNEIGIVKSHVIMTQGLPCFLWRIHQLSL